MQRRKRGNFTYVPKPLLTTAHNAKDMPNLDNHHLTRNLTVTMTLNPTLTLPPNLKRPGTNANPSPELT